MTWGRALDYCQAAGMQAVSLGADKADEDIERILETMLDKEEYAMDSFWTSGQVKHAKKE